MWFINIASVVSHWITLFEHYNMCLPYISRCSVYISQSSVLALYDSSPECSEFYYPHLQNTESPEIFSVYLDLNKR